MIANTIPDLQPRGLSKSQPASQKRAGEKASNEFAEMMRGPDHTERKDETPGREVSKKSNREGLRSAERETANPQSTYKKNESAPPARKLNDKRATGEDASAQTSAMQANAKAPARPDEKPEPDSETTDVSEVAETSDASDTSHVSKANGESSPNKHSLKLERTSGSSGSRMRELEDEQDAQVEVRKQAMGEFLEKMQNEFGISPEQIVAAYSKMSPDSLLAKPEETAKEFLGNLQIPAAKMERATDLYKGMVQVTSEADLNEKLASMDEALEALTDSDLDPEMLVTPKEQVLSQLSEALESLDQAIPKLAQKSDGKMAAVKPEALAKVEDMHARLAQLMREGVKKADLGEASGASDELNSDDLALDPAQKFELGAQSAQQPVAAEANASKDFGGQSQQGEAGSKHSAKGEVRSAKKTEQTKSVEATSKQVEFKSVAAPNAATSELKTGDVAQAVNSDSSPAPLTVRVTSASDQAAVLARPPSSEEEAGNVKELLKQAQIVLKKGGGDIEMALRPEGVGNVKLKVSVENGQVNVQMLTENDTAKKMLEKGLGELKSSLAQHQLKVENIKVDVGAEIKKHMDQDASQGREQSRDAAREFARDFMQNFRDERQGFRQGLAENMGNRRSYGANRRPEMQPAAVRTSNAGESRRLNVVA